MCQFKFIFGRHQASHGASDNMSLRFGSNNDSLQTLWNNFINGNNVTVGVYVNSSFKALIPKCCSDWGNCDYLPPGYTASDITPVLYIHSLTQADVDWWNSNVANGSITVTWNLCNFGLSNGTSGSVSSWLIFRLNNIIPLVAAANPFIVPSSNCLNWGQFDDSAISIGASDFCDWLSITGTVSSFNSFDGNFTNYGVNFNAPVQVQCDDLRSSTGTNECQISLNVLDIDDNQQTNRYTLMFQPDAQHTFGQVTNLGMIPFRSIIGASAHFTGGVVRGAGTITIRGHIEGYLPSSLSVGDLDVPYLSFVDEDVILLQATFEPCCDYPYQFSETYSEILDDIVDGYDDVNYSLQCEVTSIEWSGFENLTDYCCDDSECSEDDYEYPPNDTINTGGEGGGGEGGGGESSGTDPCVCDWLESIDTKLGLINTSLISLQCICTSIDSLTSVLRGKELSVTNSVTVTPSTAQITTPVNAPVTVNPPVNQITVNPTPITNTVTPCSPTVTVNPTDLTGLISAINGLELSASVTNNIDGLTCENNLGQQESLACIIKEALNYGGESISEIHKKALSTVDDCCNEEINLIDTFITSNDEGCKVTFADLVKNKEFGSYLDVTIENDEIMQFRKTFKDPLGQG